MAHKFPNSNFVPPKPGTGLRLVCAEAPGADEEIALEPLVGGAGRRFDALCRAAGLRREQLTLVNTLQCRPPNNIYPTDSAARWYISASEAHAAQAHCFKHHVEPLLKSRPWQRIDLLGDKALRVLSPDTPHDGVENNRGFPVPIAALGNAKIGIATYHPSYIARDQIQAKVVIADLTKGLQLAKESYTPYPDLGAVAAFQDTTFAFDIENDPKSLSVYMVGFSAAAGKAICVPFRGAYIPEIKRIFANARVVIGQNSLQHDEPILQLQGVRVRPEAEHHDIMLMQHLLMPDLPHKLEFIASIFVPKERWKCKKGESEEIYNCRDVDVTFQAWQQLLPMLKQEKLFELYKNIQVPLARICYSMRAQGIRVEPGRVKEIRERLSREVADLESRLPECLQTYQKPIKKRIPAPAGTLSAKTKKPLKFIMSDAFEETSPWRSNDELAKYLYENLKLPPQLHAKTRQVTVDKGALDKLSRKLRTKEYEKHPKLAEATKALAALRAIKKLAALLSGFATDTLAKAEVVHTHFNVHGTASGRLSSSGPNLQNQPETARYLYVPRNPDWELMSCDFSGIENKITAYLADDQERLARFLNDPGYSEHKHAVEIFFGIPYAEVVKDNDRETPYGKAKAIVHGANYGLGARKMSLMYDIPESEARTLLALWKAAIHKTTAWQERTAKLAEQTGILTTPFGRKRWFWTDSFYTEALSFLPQSTAADVIYRAMIALYHDRVGMSLESARLVIPYVEPLPRPATLLLQVHDELLFEYPRERREEVAACVRRVMTQPIPELGGLSFSIGMAVGPSWGELKSL